LSISPTQASITAGQAASYNITIRNNDSGCAATTFTLSNSHVASVSTQQSISQIRLTSGQSTTANITANSSSAGSYQIAVSLADNDGVNPSHSAINSLLSLTVSAVATAPSYVLTITSPASGATVSGTIQIKGTAPGMLNVEVYDANGGVYSQVTPDSAGNFSAGVDTKKLANGSQTLTVMAWDSAPGQPFTHSDKKLLSLNVQNIVSSPLPSPTPTSTPTSTPNFPGSVSISSPSAGTILKGVVKLSAQASGTSSRVVMVNFLLDGQLLGTSTAQPYALYVDASKLVSGAHQLQAQAVLLDGNVGNSAAISVSVDTTPSYKVSVANYGGSLQQAITALGGTGGSVYVPAGYYNLSGLTIPSNVQLIGAGIDKTIITAPAASNFASILRLQGSNIAVMDMTINANGSAQAGGSQWATEIAPNTYDVQLQRLKILDVGGTGVYLWGVHQRVSVQDVFMDGASRGTAGVSDRITDTTSSDTSVLRSTIQNFRDYGINFYPWTPTGTFPGSFAVAYKNTITNITNPATDNGTNEGAIWTGGFDAVIWNNTINGTGWDGIETFGNSQRASIRGNSISNTHVAIYLEHQTYDSLIADNNIVGGDVGINIEWWYGGQGSKRQTIINNTITGVAQNGIFVDVGANDNVISGNRIYDSAQSAIVLQGTTGNKVQNNDLRDRKTTRTQSYSVRESYGRWDDGTLATPDYNSVTGNDCRGSTSGAVLLYGAHSTQSGNIWP
jgi:parallel beta-helix repeat protein